MEYNFRAIEEKWQQEWIERQTYRVTEDPSKPKFYVLDMFPYPSGAGLHVGHPLGYIASDIYSRYKRLKGFNVLHPMGYDAYGLPAEQYAIQTGQHPAVTTVKNINRYREQLDKIGFCYDWSREVRTCEPEYYQWTQWAFVQMFNSYYCNDEQQARPIAELVEAFAIYGNDGLNAACSEPIAFTAHEWNTMTERRQQEILMNYRIAYLGNTMVNWCPALGTVLANDEVSEGLSVRGGHPVEQKVMRQWCLRVSAYAPRLLDGLDTVEWTDSIKETQRNWIGRSEGAELHLPLAPSKRGGTKADYSAVDAKYRTGQPALYKILKENAKNQRKNPTQAEEFMWQALRNKNLKYKFRRQHPIDSFIADFVCLEKKLIVEIDGEYHNFPEQKELDAARSEILESLGYSIIRFTNEEVLFGIDTVIGKINAALSPSLGGGQGEVVVFTTRADTVFGVTFMVLAPESEWVEKLVVESEKQNVADYIASIKHKTERERMMEKAVTGVFSGSYAINPLTQEQIPIWIADYVLAGYGTGAIMAVPAHDSRDYAFAKKFNLPITPLIEGCDVSEESFDAKEGVMINSPRIGAEREGGLVLNGLTVPQAIEATKEYIARTGLGRVKVNFRLRDAIFSRQRYWGEPFPVYYKEGMPYVLDNSKLPLQLPEIDKFLPTEQGEPPLGHAKNWVNEEGFPLELCTMPGFAGSSAYYLRYMDPHNHTALVSKEANEYWRNVDLYIGGTEHATGHLIYSRFWNKFLFDLGVVCEQEPFKKLVNQGMIQGRSNFVYRIKDTNTFVSFNLKGDYDTTPIHVDVNMVSNDILDIERFKNWNPEYNTARFILEGDKYICGWAVEKMSKSMFNVVNPDDIVERYGADTLRLYEMFLGPLEQSKPWDTNGIDGVHRFLRKMWNLFYGKGSLSLNKSEPTRDELKSLHKLIKKVSYDIENFSFNTSVAAFMICVNELTTLKCSNHSVLKELLILLAPFAPHVTEELWSAIGEEGSVCDARWPQCNEAYLKEDTVVYGVAFNGKARFEIAFAAGTSKEEVEATTLAHETTLKYLDGKTPKKVIVVPNKLVNLVI